MPPPRLPGGGTPPLGFAQCLGQPLLQSGVAETINLQRDGGDTKPCQVKRVRRIILNYRLGGDN